MNKMRKSVSIVLCFLLILGVCFVSAELPVSALYKRHGYINSDAVNIRSGPGTSNASLGKLGNNTPVLISDVGFDSSGYRWYKLTAYTSGGDIEGYVHSDYVTVTGSDKTYSAVVNRTTTVRSAPGTWNSAVVQMTNGMIVTVIGCENDSDGDMWYHISFMSAGVLTTGYIYETCIDINVEYTEDPEFEKSLNEQGFPESYKPYLRNLHAMYPQWKFIADHLEMTWDEAVEGETALGRTLVSPSVCKAWKSMNDGTYNWDKGTFKAWDSGGWVQAADSVVKYYLDPRNFLTASGIFQFISMEYYPDSHTKENLLSAIDGTFMEGEFPEESYETYADVLMDAAKESGISPIALASMIVVEQGSRGTGKSISGTYPGYEGYYNFYNIRAYKSGEYGAVEFGLMYAKSGNGTKATYYRPWNTRAKSIIGGACWYHDLYVSKGQDTLYYKKFNVVYKPYFSHQYMTNVQAAVSEASKTADGYKKVMDTELTFNIPVYKSMPKTAAPYPTTKGSNDCYLSDLSVDSFNFTPTFNRYTNEYEFVVPAYCSSVVVTPVASDSEASVTGGGVIKLNYGNNAVKIKVVSTSGLENIYTLYIYRETPADVELDFEISNYTSDGIYICGIGAGTSAETVITNFNIVGGSAVIKKPDGSTAMFVGTGDSIEIKDNNGTVRYTYTLVVQNDVNGDGALSLVDISWLQRHLVLIQKLEGAYAKAADLNGDGKITLIDLSRLQRKLLKID